jgi:hypothetical protein
MRKMIGFVFGLLGKLLLLSLVVLFVGVLYVGAYFYVKSGEPMTVAEAQQRAPGLTFRDFWASRVEQWEAKDDQKEKTGSRRTCKFSATGVILIRIPNHALLALIMREKNDSEYSRKILAGLNNPPSVEAIHNAPYLDAVWAILEAEAWHGFAKGIRGCETIYPTPADVSANHTQETGTLP